MNTDIILTLCALALAIFLFIRDWVRVDVVGIIMMILLPVLGLVTPAEALSGLSSNAVVSIIAVLIIGAGLDRTGVMNLLAQKVLAVAGQRESRVSSLIALTVAFISGFMQNIGAAALFLPAAKRIASSTGIPAGRILLPMAYCAIIGGCLTLVGSSPLIMLNDLMTVDGRTYEPFGLFSVTPIGMCLIFASLAYFLLFSRFILPASKGNNEVENPMSLLTMSTYHGVGHIHELLVSHGGRTGTLAELDIRREFLISVVGIHKAATSARIKGPMAEDSILPGDVIVVFGEPDHVQELAERFNWDIRLDLDTFAEDFSPFNSGLVEGVIPPRSKLVGTDIKSYDLRPKYNVNPLCVFRGGQQHIAEVTTMTMQAGDAILLHGHWNNLAALYDTHDVFFSHPILRKEPRSKKMPYALASLAIAMVLAMMGTSLAIALLTGALGMILTRTLSIDEAYQSVDWMSVFLLAGLIPLGVAFEKTGAAGMMADAILGALGVPSPLVLTTVIAALTAFFTLVTSNVGATVLLVPLAMNMALEAGADPRIAALAVALGASNTFILPTHQVNALVMRPGGFKTGDYIRAGTGMTVLYLVVMIAAMWLFYGL